MQDRKPLFPEVPENPNIEKLFNDYLQQHEPSMDSMSEKQMAVVGKFILQARSR